MFRVLTICIDLTVFFRMKGANLSYLRISPRFFIFGCCIGLFLIYGLFTQLPDGKLHLIFCDVGQGDAIVVVFPNGQDMLIDGGPNNRVLTCLGNNRPFYDRTLDLVVATHPQEDHIGGLVEVIKRYKVKHFATVAVAHTSKTFADLWLQIKQKHVPSRFLYEGEIIKINNVSIDVLWPDREWLLDQAVSDDRSGLVDSTEMIDTKTNLNNFSLYLHLKYQHFDALFTGDGDVTMQNLLDKTNLLRLEASIEVLKVPHHGSKTALSATIINLLRPKTDVIQVGKNSYGHPNNETIKSLQSFGNVFRTDTNGAITISTNGETVDVKVEN